MMSGCEGIRESLPVCTIGGKTENFTLPDQRIGTYSPPMEPSYYYGLGGGCLIGLGSLVALIATGKIPGISGIFGRLLRPAKNDTAWRLVFLLGLILGALNLFRTVEFAALYRIPEGRSLIVYAIAGLLVGFGTRIGRGCTSGHGVCGIGFGFKESIVATLVFMVAGFLTVFLFKLATAA